MMNRKKNEQTQNYQKSTLEVVQDVSIKKFNGDSFKIALLENKVDWISSRRSKY